MCTPMQMMAFFTCTACLKVFNELQGSTLYGKLFHTASEKHALKPPQKLQFNLLCFVTSLNAADDSFHTLTTVPFIGPLCIIAVIGAVTEPLSRDETSIRSGALKHRVPSSCTINKSYLMNAYISNVYQIEAAATIKLPIT